MSAAPDEVILSNSNDLQHSDESSSDQNSAVVCNGVLPHPPSDVNGAHLSNDHVTDHDGRHVVRRQQSLQHRNTWPTNVDPAATRGLMKCQLKRIREKVKVANQKVEEEISHEKTAQMQQHQQPEKGQLESDIAGVPSAHQQRWIISELDTENHGSRPNYAVSLVWYHAWEQYLGLNRRRNTLALGNESHTIPPISLSPVDMDSSNDENNVYVSEQVWTRLVKWYGLSPLHQLNRRLMYFNDLMTFDVCLLSPFSGIIDHARKAFNRFEEIGYIEIQLRRRFNVASHRKSRLWISERSSVPRFRLLLERDRMLNDSLHRQKSYILALEACAWDVNGGTWPTGDPGEPQPADFSKYDELIASSLSGLGTTNAAWTEEIDSSVDELRATISDHLIKLIESFIRDGQSCLQERVRLMTVDHKEIKTRMRALRAAEKILKERESALNEREAQLNNQEGKQEQINKEDKQDQSEANQTESVTNGVEDQESQIEFLKKQQDSKICLNVGGHVFTTSVHTLTSDHSTTLAAMFDGRHVIRQDNSDGCCFIDRDGSHFRFVLNYLRDGSLDATTLPADKQSLRELLREARYYKIGGLVDCIERIENERPVGD